MPDHLSLIDNHPLIWRAGQQPTSQSRLLTRHEALDSALSGGLVGAGAVRLSCKTGIGELSMLKAVLSNYRQHKLCVFINPPGMVHAAWLASANIGSERVYQVAPGSEDEALWAAEQCLKSSACHCVLLWLARISAKQARRLQVAATHNDALVVLYMPPRRQLTALPVSQDLILTPCDGGLAVEIKKQAQGWPVEHVFVPLSHTPTNQAIAAAMALPTLSSNDIFVAG